MGSFLSRPLTSKAIERIGNEDLMVGTCEMQGRRGNMQDSHKVILDYSNGSSFFGIFDGHGISGEWAAEFFSENLSGSLIDKEKTKENIVETCLEIDKAFVTMSRKVEKDYLDSGTTAVFCLLEKYFPSIPNEEEVGEGENYNIVNQSPSSSASFPPPSPPTTTATTTTDTSQPPLKNWKALIGNIGDSRCVLIRDGVAKEMIPLTSDHKPSDQKERERIETAGGMVTMDRVDGLALSRAFGDFRLKSNEEFPPDKQKVISVPDFVEIEGIGGDDILLLMCDGVYEKTSNSHVVNTIVKYYNQTPLDPGKVLQRVFDERVEHSDDNMTAMLILFRDGSAYHDDKIEFIECELRHDDDKAFRKACREFAESHNCNASKRKSNPVTEDVECQETKTFKRIKRFSEKETEEITTTIADSDIPKEVIDFRDEENETD